ncbi:hypothetical protein LV457_02790 [Mycobacterium sp. MYCO198283]|uniref:hypothetical protein n=1 Tax=Mycobacterium sp. MYCO198283 TaxID=2883505 RepID=UPI001E485DE0|nr:hypothetical protein [Mycobacterium sp. MYCO198283]MCG5431216.1 hypothetical protein [Mycobacterium sp. MYCO198283]
MGKAIKQKRRHPISVAEAKRQLAAARRREEAAPPAVDLANLDTPGVSHAEQYAEFLNRPGDFYVARIEIPLDDEIHLRPKLGVTATLKADAQQLPYLVEVLRQIRGALGDHARINLVRATPAGDQPEQASRASSTAPTRAFPTSTGPLQATPEELSAIREMRARAEARNGFTMPPPNGKPMLPDGPPQLYGRDWVAEGQKIYDGTVAQSPWQQEHAVIADAAQRDLTREEIARMLPGRTRAEVAAELGKTPEELGGNVYHADVMPEQLAADLGVPVESLRRIPMTGGGHAWTVAPAEPATTPQPAPPPGTQHGRDGDQWLDARYDDR